MVYNSGMEHGALYRQTAEHLRCTADQLRESVKQSLGVVALITVAGYYAYTANGRYVPDAIPENNREEWRRLRDEEEAIMKAQDQGKELNPEEDRQFQDLSRRRGDLEIA